MKFSICTVRWVLEIWGIGVLERYWGIGDIEVLEMLGIGDVAVLEMLRYWRYWGIGVLERYWSIGDFGVLEMLGYWRYWGIGDIGVLEILLLLLLKKIDNTRPGEGDWHLISPKTPAPHYRGREEKGEIVEDKKERATRPTKRHWTCS